MTTPPQDVITRLTEAFDFHDPEYTPQTAEDVNAALREKTPVAYSPAHGGMWVLSRYEHVREALRDHETFSSGSGVHFPRAAGMPKFSPIDYDPPEHGAIRRLMAPPVDREAVGRLEPAVARLATDLVAPIVRRGHGDLVAELSRPFAIGTLALAIGLSEKAQQEVRELTATMWRRMAKDGDSSAFWPAYRDLLSGEIERARREPGDYYLSWLVRARIDGEPVSDELLYSVIVSYCVAGHDNTMNTISRILWHLAGDPALQRRIKAEPGLAAQVAEETLRRWCPTDRFTRVTTRDVTIDGVTIPKGSRVVLLFDAANRDPDTFPDPDAFRPDRDDAHRHLSFGNGLHHCLGARLARAEFKAVLGELARHPEYRLTEVPRLSFENGRHIMFDRIPVRFEPSGTTAGKAGD
ncbi:cytochrome P450 [Streptomyces spinosirectus]|uniref:cytochrome P450 n=1 Tax=Streptomyces spinosirectus TaxID=2906474 RepID=UPI001F1C3B4F|nr:cytochrome P450 [Streptomyces spinosirectus]UIR20950.1 cytochrome P450 [Streptomyces spinosirectus]